MGSKTALHPLVACLVCLIAAVSTFAAPPLVSDVAASEGPAAAADGRLVSRVTVSFVPPSPRLDWVGVEVYAIANGSGARLVGSGASSPLAFELETSGAEVTLYVVSVASDDSRTPLAASPAVTVLLDGRPSPPVPVSGLWAQPAGDGVKLSWAENREADISRYEVAELASPPTSPAGLDSAPVVASLAANGVAATGKQMWQAPGGSLAAAHYFFVRPVNSSGLAGPWSPKPPAVLAVSQLAPDGTTDTGVPNWNVYQSLGFETPGGGVVRFYITWVSRWVFDARGPLNREGIVALGIRVFYTGGDGAGSAVFRFPDNGAEVNSPGDARVFSINLPNATLTGEEHWFENYFGQGSHQGVTYTVPRSTGTVFNLPVDASSSASMWRRRD